MVSTRSVQSSYWLLIRRYSDESYHFIIPDCFVIDRPSSRELDYKVYPSTTVGLELEVPCDRKGRVVFTNLSVFFFLLSAYERPSAPHNQSCFVVNIVAGRAFTIWLKYVCTEVDIDGHPFVRFFPNSESVQKVSGGYSKENTLEKKTKSYVRTLTNPLARR